VTRRFSTRGFNITLAAALALVLLGGGAFLLGPGWGKIERYESELRERTERAESWALQRTVFRNPGDGELEARRLRWAELKERVEVVDGTAALIAHVAEKLQAPSISAIEVEIRGARDLAEAEEGLPVTRLHAPDGDEDVALVAIPILVSFRSSYSDALDLIDRIERRKVAARLDSLDVKRQDPGVALNLGLTWYTRNPKQDAG
jgi:hypothetical protein